MNTVFLSWIHLSLLSAAALGLYDVAKKASARDNAVFGALLGCSVWGALAALPWLLIARVHPQWAALHGLAVGELGPRGHVLVLLKAILVTGSWTLTFLALQRIPLTIAAPIRATAPLYTMVGAVLIYGESPSARQWAGIALILVGHAAFSRIGRREGLRFSTSPHLWALLAGTILASASGLWDKALLQKEGLDPAAMQIWFTFDNVALQALLFLVFGRGRKGYPFQWRWTMPATGLLLLAADAAYFHALAQPEAMVMVVSALRRSNVLVAFFVGGIAFREANRRPKAIALSVLVGGLALLL
ncbi:MAG: DMT family transporter [Fibrobacteria bacterium]|nr:DMT family transporter [Fibrobacteria bacterium]